jgi:CO/xanthine dehydrogenase Mo-binding subunit
MMGPYDIPNVWIEGFDVVVNKPKSAAYRAPGVPAAVFTMETAEEYVFNAKGHMFNCSFLDYRMPVCLDLPMLDTVIVEVPNPNHPYGVRGVGETSVIPPLAAITNAVYHAIGIR